MENVNFAYPGAEKNTLSGVSLFIFACPSSTLLQLFSCTNHMHNRNADKLENDLKFTRMFDWSQRCR